MVKKAASLIVFYGVFFMLVFLISAGTGFLQIWLKAVSTIPIQHYLDLKDVIVELEWIVPFTLYLTIIFSMNYASVNETAPLAAFIIVIVLSSFFTFGAAKGLDNAYNMASPPLVITQKQLGKSGLLLKRGTTVYTLLDEPSLEAGSRVISIPGEPLFYQELPLDEAGNIIKLPNAPFKENALLGTTELTDLSLSGKYLSARYDNGLYSFAAWTLALILFLTSLSFLFQIGEWHIANIFLGIIVFRGILAFEVFFNSASIQTYMYDFFRGALSKDLVSPFIFTVISVLILIYVFLYHVAKGKK
ncbi:MAG: hypothetical protein Ta2F_08640 [Termitinemataceae bacterium]|nr:MAG: hypothetical protein Ta2F_08640 [Termitinemataceae bacterium]